MRHDCGIFTGVTRAALTFLNRLRFVAPVRSGSRVRGRFLLKQFDVRPGERWQATWDVTIEIEGMEKPAIVAEWLNAGFF